MSNKSSEKWPWPNGKINKLTAENIQNCRINHVAISHLFSFAMCLGLLVLGHGQAMDGLWMDYGQRIVCVCCMSARGCGRLLYIP